MGSCNNEAMQARSIGLTNGNCYTSELTVTVNPSFNTKTVQCAHSPITGPERIISSSMLTVLSGKIEFFVKHPSLGDCMCINS